MRMHSAITCAILLAGPLLLASCSDDADSDWCGPAPLTAEPPTAERGSIVVVGSKAASCDLGLAEDATYTLTLHNDVQSAEPEPVTVRVGADGAFSADVPIPADYPTGQATVLVAGSPLDKCTGSGSCAAYLVKVSITD